MTNLDLSAAIAAATNELQGGTKSEPQGQPAKKSAPRKSATTKSATAKTDTPKTKGGAKYVIPAAFKQAIEDYLTGRPDMSEKLKQPGKSIDKCCEYIYDRMLKRSQKERGGATTVGMYVASEEIFGMAVHYYDESDEDLKKEV